MTGRSLTENNRVVAEHARRRGSWPIDQTYRFIDRLNHRGNRQCACVWRLPVAITTPATLADDIEEGVALPGEHDGIVLGDIQSIS